MATWSIPFATHVSDITTQKTSLNALLRLPHPETTTAIVPFREMVAVNSFIPMTRTMLKTLIQRIPTKNGGMPFADARVTTARFDPSMFKIGQRFVYREKYIAMLERLDSQLSEFLVTPGGLADLGPHIAFGKDAVDNNVMAYFIPPIIERHDTVLAVLDGIHRGFVTYRVGKTITVVLIENIRTPFPCIMRGWEEIKLLAIADRPKDVRDRYFGLEPDLFRNLKAVGIDG